MQQSDENDRRALETRGRPATGSPEGGGRPGGRPGDPGAAGGAPKLSAFLVTWNERSNIDRCLEALRFCDEIVVVDSESDDGTAEIARRYTDRVVVESWRGYAAQKQRALDLCLGTWTLSVDADEVVSPELARAIRAVVDGSDQGKAGFKLRRQVRYLGQWIRHGGWGADWVVRLVLREKARFSDARVHEKLLVDGRIGRLTGILEHHSYRDLDHHWEKIRELSRLWAQDARDQGRRAGWWDLAFRPPARFLRIYFWRLGLLDGWRGLVIAWMAAAYVMMKYARLREERPR